MAPVHPELESLLAYLRDNPAPPAASTPIGERRAAHVVASSLTETPPVAMDEIRDVTVAGGAGPLPSRLYVPSNDNGRGLTVYFHGGGFVLGTLDSYDGLGRHLAEAFATPLLSVEYRLAPEHPFPSATDDALAATRDVLARASSWGFADRRVLVAGDSAGATLAAVVAQQLRGETGLLAGQVLLYPTMGPELVTASAHAYATGYALEMADLHTHYAEYLGDYRDHTDPRVTPLLSDDVDGCAPAVIVVAEFDPLRDEAVAYAGLLEHSHVPVDLMEAEGMIHSFFKLGGLVADVASEFQTLGQHVRRLLADA